MNRRTMLKGLGGVAVGLPLLEEMVYSAAGNVAKDVPVRAFNVFFGLGIPAPLQKEGYEGVLEPLKPLRDKLLIMRDVDQVRCDVSGINAHFDGAGWASARDGADVDRGNVLPPKPCGALSAQLQSGRNGGRDDAGKTT